MKRIEIPGKYIYKPIRVTTTIVTYHFGMNKAAKFNEKLHVNSEKTAIYANRGMIILK